MFNTSPPGGTWSDKKMTKNRSQSMENGPQQFCTNCAPWLNRKRTTAFHGAASGPVVVIYHRLPQPAASSSLCSPIQSVRQLFGRRRVPPGGLEIVRSWKMIFSIFLKHFGTRVPPGGLGPTKVPPGGLDFAKSWKIFFSCFWNILELKSHRGDLAPIKSPRWDL